MKIIRNPSISSWPELLARPVFDREDLTTIVADIMNAVKLNGDDALREMTKKFDGIEISDIEVSKEEIEAACAEVPVELQQAISVAKSNIEKFHCAQVQHPEPVETAEGVICWRKQVPIEKVGLYVPAGTAPLFSTVLMLSIPATIAGCREIVLCSPPDLNGRVNPAVLFAARLCGVTKIYRIGGAQAIAAMAFGTQTVSQCYKIFGPGNQFVTMAKQLVAQYGTAIDMPAGPSEVAVIADETSIPEFVAADLLSQAEHGIDSHVVLITTCEKVLSETLESLQEQLEKLPRRDIAAEALKNSVAVVVTDIEEAVAIANEYAAEHLILAVDDAETIAEKIINAGSVFIGNYSCESAGDYASGTNHTLPTNGFAKSFSGVSLDSFVKNITFQKLTATGIRNIGPAIELMAAAENLDAHKQAVSLRIKRAEGEALCST